MNDEFKLRYGKDHGSYVAGYESLKAQAGRLGISALTNFPNCSLFKEELDVHKAYRMGFFEKWKKDKRPPRWTNRKPPEWWTNKVENP
jgi:hypothetical protein